MDDQLRLQLRGLLAHQNTYEQRRSAALAAERLAADELEGGSAAHAAVYAALAQSLRLGEIALWLESIRSDGIGVG